LCLHFSGAERPAIYSLQVFDKRSGYEGRYQVGRELWRKVGTTKAGDFVSRNLCGHGRPRRVPDHLFSKELHADAVRVIQEESMLYSSANDRFRPGSNL